MVVGSYLYEAWKKAGYCRLRIEIGWSARDIARASSACRMSCLLAVYGCHASAKAVLPRNFCSQT
jgi:hypothetical protein